MSSIPTIPVPNETNASFSRFTRDGRRLTYELRVLQQPQRARACGSGAKSSADRRPVDPPPVIELKIFEGEANQRTDITFTHKANFFIFTTLETARPIAQARGQPAAQPPVLTGSPVSGAALLDRPSPAAYFIFPDLSVRHEGKYRLSFNLYEELKDPKDEDVGPMTSTGQLMSNPMMMQESVRFRTEVRSKPFVVFSAKKFPGLTESTSLSRVVAEQGCRVRIRRDVRMRRREGKSGKECDDEGGYASYPEPTSADPYRQSSIEQPSSTIETTYYSAPYTAPPSYTQQPMPAAYPPQPRPSSQQQFHHPQQAQAVDTQQHAYSQGYNSGSSYSTTPPSSHTRHPSLASSNENMMQAYQTAGQPTAQQPMPQAYGQMHQISPPSVQRPTYHEIDSTDIGPKSAIYHEQLNEARSLGIDNGYQSNPPPAYSADIRSVTPSAASLPPLKTLPMDNKPDLPAYPDIYNIHPGASASIAASIRAGAKRGYDRTFDSGLGISMANGSRPEAAGQEVPQLETDDGYIDINDLLNSKTLSYRRANGTLASKKIPAA